MIVEKVGHRVRHKRRPKVIAVVDDPPRLPRLWSEKALAERLSVSRGTVRNLWRSGRLPGVRILTGDDEARCPLRFKEGDVIKLLRGVQRGRT